VAGLHVETQHGPLAKTARKLIDQARNPFAAVLALRTPQGHLPARRRPDARSLQHGGIDAEPGVHVCKTLGEETLHVPRLTARPAGANLRHGTRAVGPAQQQAEVTRGKTTGSQLRTQRLHQIGNGRVDRLRRCKRLGEKMPGCVRHGFGQSHTGLGRETERLIQAQQNGLGPFLEGARWPLAMATPWHV
jgi:hypothetical protein